ncbi:MAG: hypothetical protein JWM64_945 [Frankiales bacterium]|nr:hypothetical protein [Frankiales bacterium]
MRALGQTRAAWRAVGALAAGGCVVLLTAVPAAQAQSAAVAFSATASAESVRIGSQIASFPATSSPIDSGGPASQVSLSSSDGGFALSAAPDPGSFATSLPGLGAGLAAGLLPIPIPVPVPGYPLTARADNQNPSQVVGAGAYELNASVKPTTARALTTTGGSSPAGNTATIRAEALVEATSAGVDVTAVSDVQGITVGPLTIGRVRAESEVSADVNSTLTMRSKIDIDAATIGTLPVGLTPEGFTVAGALVPADTQGVLNAVLSAANVSVKTFPAMKTKTGVVSAGVVITQKTNLPMLGDTVLTYRFGGTSVNLLAAAADAATDPVGTGSAPLPPPGSSTPGDLPVVPSSDSPGLSAGTDTSTGTDTAPLDPVVPGGSADSSGTGALPPPQVDGTAGGSAPGTTNGGSGGSLVPTALAIPAIDSDGLYLSICTAGLLGLGLMQLLRLLGVKLTWTS